MTHRLLFLAAYLAFLVLIVFAVYGAYAFFGGQLC